MYKAEHAITKSYRNYKGEVSDRTFIPLILRFDENNEWHGENVWIIHAYDLDKQDYRDFCLKDFL